MTSVKPERVRDPLHNLIEFDCVGNQLEYVLWQVVKSSPFQRLRRVRQLGFSEFVYPGATHTRFAHSIGVFHTARQLMKIIASHVRANRGRDKRHQLDVALAAALVHDVGHGMFSHAFEEVGRELNLKMANHELVSGVIIKDSEISRIFKEEMGTGFANDVADVIGGRRPGNLYDAVVSSQFDADRLDYMQRDRLMTGVQNSGIDFVWLMSNLEVGELPIGSDDQQAGTIETLVLGPKASHAAEAYILSLFQLYPTVYLHKTTRAAEKMFSALMVRILTLARDDVNATGLPTTHPIVRFARDPNSLDNALALDDTVFWGALSLMTEASDPFLREYALRLRDRKLPKCIDVRSKLIANIVSEQSPKSRLSEDEKERLDRHITSIEERLKEWSESRSTLTPRILTDRALRDPYKRFQESKGPLNQIRIRTLGSGTRDMAEISPIISGIEPFELFRVYVDEQDVDARAEIGKIIALELKGNGNGV